MKADDVCRRAAELVSSDRAATHGDKVANHENIAAMWSAFLGDQLVRPIDAYQAALMMACLKIARTKLGAFNIDDLIDLAGYAGCAAEIAERIIELKGKG